MAWGIPVNDPPADTTEGKPLRKILTKDSAEQYSNYLLTTHPTYLDHWINDVTFVFDDFKYEHLPEEIVLPLVTGDEQFTLTWYGRINSTYKRRWGRQHHGLDIDLRTGDTVVAAFDGIVRYAQYNKSGFGNCVIIRHLNGLETVYAHLSKIDVQPNSFVTSGQSIGLGGNTGHSKGPHLHFETRYKDFSFDPEMYINVSTQSLKTDTLFLTPKSFTAYKHLEDRKQKAAKTKPTADSAAGICYIPFSQPTTDNNNNPDVSINTTPTKANTATNTSNSKTNTVSNTTSVQSGTSSATSSTTNNNTATKTNTPTSTVEKAPAVNTVPVPTTAQSTKTAVSTTPKTGTAKTKPTTQAKPGTNKIKTAKKDSKTPTTAATKKTTAAKPAITKKTPAPTKPKAAPVKKSGKSYTIVAGDNLTVISKKTGVSIQKIRQLNVIKADNKLMPGQTLRLN